MKKVIALIFCGISLSLFSKGYSQKYSFTKEVDYLTQNGETPTAYVVGKFSSNDIVMLAEDHAIKDNLDFVAGLIPHLYKAGVYNLCMEFGASEMQSKLDSLINAKQYNENVARDMIYYYNVGWAYREYMDIYKAAWRFNKSLPVNAKRFRIVNLSYRYNWGAYKSPITPENIAGVFYMGTPDKYRAELIENEIIGKNEKALVFVGGVHAFTKFKKAVLNMNSDNFCDYDDGFLGNRLYKKHPGKVFNILLHCALYNKPDQKIPIVSSASGAIEIIMQKLKNKPLGFDLINSPLGDFPDNSVNSIGYKNLTVGQVFDGYVFLKPLDQLTGCTIDSLFFKNKTWEETKKQMPDPNWFVAQNMDEYWKKIKTFVDIRQRYKDVIDSTVPKVSRGRLIRLKNFNSRFVQPRNVDVWLPENYDDSKRYSVLYMHDGQMLYDSAVTWNHQEWRVDEHLTNLLENGTIKDCIVVGIWNNGKYRHAEYYPQKALVFLPQLTRDSLNHQYLQGKPLADNYLSFLTKELKPFVDSAFATLPGIKNTFIAGSSMGGLISIYAMCEYPDIFGGAACLSTHWIGNLGPTNVEIPRAFVQYLKVALPPAKTHKLYFDYGTVGLDSNYKPHQQKVDALMTEKGYSAKNWMTKEFKGADHSEKAWDQRLDIPISFLLKK